MQVKADWSEVRRARSAKRAKRARAKRTAAARVPRDPASVAMFVDSRQRLAFLLADDKE